MENCGKSSRTSRLKRPLDSLVSLSWLPLLAVSAWLTLPTSFSEVAAQSAAVGSADALVLTAISLSSPQGLLFGNVHQGVPKSVPSDNSNAATFSISGSSRAGINMYLQLPQYMTHTSGGDRMSILFGSTDASIDTTAAGDPTGAGISGWLNTDPYELPGAALIGSGGTDLYLGGKIVPSPLQTPGNYEADIVLTVAYNGL